ncbi:triglyceride lipase [Neofusicoccum parvum]|nr:triglyceride lipase [Neofusicoccum parvum]
MLVVQGEADPLTYAENTEWDFDQTCAAFPDTRATYQSYPGLNHDVSFQASQPNYVRWIRERFEGVEVARGCVKETVRPVTDKYGTVQIAWSGSA